MTTLTKSQQQFLKQRAHHLNPVVTIGGDGLKPTVLAEADQALSHHELIKVKLHSGEREERESLIETLAAKSRASVIQRIGKVAVLYRPHPKKPVIKLPA